VLSKSFDDVVTIDTEGNVTYFQRYYGELSFEHDLRDFPLDSHMLPIELISRGYSPKEVALVAGELVDQGETFSIVDWEVGHGAPRSGTVYIKPVDRHLTAFYYEIPARRYAAFYIWKVVVPLSLIVFMSWAVFLIEPSQAGPQIGISTASVLTLILFQFHLSKLVPSVPYFTRADHFSTGAMLLVFMALAEAVLSNALIRLSPNSLALRMDRWSRLLFPTAFVGLLIFAFFV
jgi:hypothetical protein